ncbi:hypothetical protein [Metabacillus litoralis]|uniref:hypothetical protein n=1 Tax=Metabacillus litoralis TaxID=152268 RepID=UPI0014461239|nr:hypothetical protein [Metabacillus litoralis]
MKCGSKCFYVELEVEGETRMKAITARTPAEARKTIRLEYGDDANIVSVLKDKNNKRI